MNLFSEQILNIKITKTVFMLVACSLFIACSNSLLNDNLWAQSVSEDYTLDKALEDFPIEEGLYREYVITHITEDHGFKCLIMSRMKERISNVSHWSNGVKADLIVEETVVNYKPLEYSTYNRSCRPTLLRFTYRNTVVVLKGSMDKKGYVYYFVDAVAMHPNGKKRIEKILQYGGIHGMEEWGIGPRYVLPLKKGNMWIYEDDRYQVVGRGPVEVKVADKVLGRYPDCFQIIGKTSGGDTTEWFCPGIGRVKWDNTNAAKKRSTSSYLYSYGKE